MFKLNVIPPTGTNQPGKLPDESQAGKNADLTGNRAPQAAAPGPADNRARRPGADVSSLMPSRASSRSPSPGASRIPSRSPSPARSRISSRSLSPSPARSVLESYHRGELVKDKFSQMVHEGRSQTEITRSLHLRRHEREELTHYMIAKEFICESHMEAIAGASQHRKFMVSFRSAGEETLKRLESGAAAKGHDILEKTIKCSSLQKAYGERAGEIFDRLKEANLTGYVGHWNEEGLAGIYVSDPHSPGGKSILPLDIHHLDDVLEKLHHLSPHWQTRVFSGDYDMHDMVTFTAGGGRPYTPLAGSSEEANIINALNHSVANQDPHRPFTDIAHNVIRHGPQVNFVSWMQANEAEAARAGLAGSVARPGSFPLAIISRGEWQLAADIDELLEIYANSRVQMKESWKPEGSFALLSNEGDSPERVFLRRRSSAISLNSNASESKK